MCRRWTVVALALGLVLTGAGARVGPPTRLQAAPRPNPYPLQRVVRVAAAANLSAALTEIRDRFAQDRGQHVQLVFGASSTLTRQILDGAPFEMFLAADEESAARLTAARLTRDSGVVYAVGRLAIFAPTGLPLDVDTNLEGLARWVKSARRGRFAIANPEVAPYGRAAEAVLRKRGLWESLRPNLVLGSTVAQALQFSTTGNTIGGLVAYSLVLTPALSTRGRHAVISESDHPPLTQRMVLMRSAGETTVDFYEYLRSEAAKVVFARHGYGLP